MDYHRYPSHRGYSATSKSEEDYRGFFYPRKLTYVLSGLKIIFGSGLVVMGALALYHKASYGRTAAGLWAGIVVVISGVFGIFSVKMNASRTYILSFLGSCILSLMASVLVIIYSGTGLARDSGFPGGFVKDPDTGDLIPVSEVNLPARKAAMFVNLVLILLGVLDILLSLPSCIICLREICECYSPSRIMAARRATAAASSGGSNEWLMSWLGQQSQIFYSSNSGLPYGKIATGASGQPYHLIPATPTRATPPYMFYPSEHSQTTSVPTSSNRHSPKKRSSSSPSRSYYPNYASPLEVYPPPAHQYYYAPTYPSPGSNFSQPAMVPWGIFTPEDYEMYLAGAQAAAAQHGHQYQHHYEMDDHYGQSRRHHYHHHHQDHRRDQRKKRRKGAPSDADLDRTYTGLDRELAEEFIEQTMDPNAVGGPSSNQNLLSEESDGAW